MGFTKIQNSDLNDIGVIGLPDTPGLSTAAMQAKFEETARDVIIPKHNGLIDELEDTPAAASLGAVAPTGRTVASNTVQGGLNKLSDDLKVVEDGMAEAIADAHTHTNKAIIDKLDDTGTGLTYDGDPVGAVTSVNSKTGAVVLDATDVGALPDTTPIPANTSDLNNDSNFVSDASYVHTDNNYDATAKGIVDGATAAIAAKSTVSWNQTLGTGQKIATISINGTPTDVYAPTGGGGGGGGDVTSVNNQTGDVSLGIDDMDDTSIASLADQDTLVYNGTAGTWGNEPLADVALTGSYANLTNTPTIPDGLADLTDDVAISSPSSGQILQHNGTKWANANMPTIPDGLADLTDDVSITSPANNQVLKYNGTSGKWENGTGGGHDMIPVVNDIATVTALTDGDDDYVINAYTAKRWSNVDRVTIWTTVAQNNDTIGTWSDTWEDDPPVRTGWIYHKLLAGILTNNNVDYSIEFDPRNREPVTLAGWRVDDEYYLALTPVGTENPQEEGWYVLSGSSYVLTTDTSVQGGTTYYDKVGCVAIKLNSPVKNANGVNVSVILDFKRTEVIPATTI